MQGVAGAVAKLDYYPFFEDIFNDFANHSNTIHPILEATWEKTHEIQQPSTNGEKDEHMKLGFT